MFIPERERTRFETEVASLAPALTRFVRARLPREVVDDVLQETWLAVWQAMPRVRDLRAFAYRVARRRISDWHRTARAGPGPVPDAMESATWDPDLSEEVLREAGVEPGSLLWRRLVDDWSIAELAAGFDLPAGTVKSRLHYELDGLKRRLHDWRSGAPYGRPSLTAFVRGRLGSDVLLGPRDWFRPVDYFQHLRIWVGSRLDVATDCRASFRIREPMTILCQDGALPAEWDLWTRRGHSLRARLHVRKTAHGPMWAYTLFGPEDGELLIKGRHAPTSDLARTMIASHRTGFVVNTGVQVATALDDVLTLTLPANVDVREASPPPAHRRVEDGRPVLEWWMTSRLPKAPSVVCRWR